MRRILVVGESEAGAARALRVAADLSVASGARLCLACAPPPLAAAAHAGEDQLSDQLFAPRDWRSPVPVFAGWAETQPGWLEDMAARCDERWSEAESGCWDALIARVTRERPCLAVAAEGRLARRLVAETDVPVWHVREPHAARDWFTLRKLRCAARGDRAAAWAAQLARSLGAELELAARPREADLAVVPRGTRLLPGMAALGTAPPVVVV
jgi:hypothetical protein